MIWRVKTFSSCWLISFEYMSNHIFSLCFLETQSDKMLHIDVAFTGYLMAVIWNLLLTSQMWHIQDVHKLIGAHRITDRNLKCRAIQIRSTIYKIGRYSQMPFPLEFFRTELRNTIPMTYTDIIFSPLCIFRVHFSWTISVWEPLILNSSI